MGMFLRFGLVHVGIQNMVVIQELITKQLIWEVQQMIGRLTEKSENGFYIVDKHKASIFMYNKYFAGQAINKLAEYETAEEEGRMMVLPCDTVYFIWDKSSGISHVRAKSILDLYLHEILGIDRDGRYWSVKEEAEKALKEMEGMSI